MLAVFPVLSLTDHLQTCPEQAGTLQQVSVCVQTETEPGYEDPFPLLSHLTNIQADTDTTSPPTTKTSYTGHSLPHIYPQFTQDVEYKISMDNIVSNTGASVRPRCSAAYLNWVTFASISPSALLPMEFSFNV